MADNLALACLAVLTRVIHTVLLPAPVVDLRHDFLGPLNARSDCLVRSWASLQPAKQIIGGLNISTHENRGHHTDDAFAPFVHLDILTCSSFVRLSTAAGSDLPVSNRCRLGETNFTFASSWSSFSTFFYP